MEKAPKSDLNYAYGVHILRIVLSMASKSVSDGFLTLVAWHCIPK
jgi:hypothetical protein